MTLGPQFDQHVESVPISVLKQMRSNELRYDVSDLAADIAKHGVREPAVVIYSRGDSTATLGEGHHRLAAAERAGLTHIPTRGIRYSGEGGGVPVRGYSRPGHVPGDLRPSEFMDWEED